jgi:DNA polymerase-3 subunit gamma/tau
MGKALYREYRPKSLETVVGQDHITVTLRNALEKGLISHAYLFTGPRGVGKTSVARILAHEINGLTYDENQTQLDIIEIDAASNRRIDEIRDLREKVNIAPTSSKYKVYIIDEVHMLTREAFNALLKTLEEPPAHAVFILATTEAHKVPETIVSRTQRFSFKPIGVESASKQLKMIADKEKIKITDEAIELIAEQGGGSFRDSISLLDQIAGFSDKEITAENISQLMGVPDSKLIRQLISSILENNIELLFETIRNLKENGANPTKTVQSLINQIRKDLLDNKYQSNSVKLVKIMKSILPYSASQSSFDSIEISLLDAMTFDELNLKSEINSKTEEATTNNLKETKISSTNKTSEFKTSKKAELVVMIPDDQHHSKVDAGDNKDNSWNDVLDSLKEQHNTLYGVLRMAESRVENDKIILTFQFEFHKKQLNQSKNMATLKSIVDKLLGSGYTIESEVIKQTTIGKNVTKENETDTLSSVSNIFGGAELLES